MPENLVTPLSNPVQSINDWRDSAAKFALFIFWVVLWHKAAGIAAGSLLILVWILCGGLLQIKSVIKEPLVVAILSLSLWRVIAGNSLERLAQLGAF